MARALLLIAAVFLFNPALLGAQDFRVISVDPGRWPVLSLTAALPTADHNPACYSLKLGPDRPPLTAGSIVELDRNEPLSVLVALDTSYTLTPAHLKAIQEVLTRYSERFGPGERLALLGFNNIVHLTTGFTGSRDAFLGDVNRLRLGGRKTELYRCLLRGIELLGKNEGGRHMLVVSDDHDEGAGLTVDQVLQSAAENGVRISVIGLGGLSSNAADKHLAALKKLAEETGGTYLPAAGADESGAGLHDILVQTRAAAPEEPERLFQLVFDLGRSPAPSEAAAAELSYTSDNGRWVAEFSLSVPADQPRVGREPDSSSSAAGSGRPPADSFLALADDDPKTID